MRKPASLREALTRAIPELRNEPDRLIIWVENGKVRTAQTGNLSFAIEYPLSILIQETSTDVSLIILAIVRWLQVEQPDLLAANADSFDFETDILDNSTADIAFTISLRENFEVEDQAQGGWEVTSLPEPDPMFDDDQSMAGDPAPPLVEVVLTDGSDAP